MNSPHVCPKMSVVICSLNGAAGVDRCIRALATQTIRSTLEVIVVDDGSADDTSEVGRAHAAIVVRHATNLGLASARNSGVAAATAPVVAFLDDDCEPEPQWAERLLASYVGGVIGVGGPILPRARDGFMLGYLERNNPLKPLESDLAKSDKILYRLKLYLRRQWALAGELPFGEVYSFAGANMSFLRQALIDAGQFDTRFHFGGEELDLCMRLGHVFPSGRLVFDPRARVSHHFKPSLYDTLRRSRAYGFGSARLYRKWPSVPPTIFPGPFIVLAMLLVCIPVPGLVAAAIAMPQLLYPQGLRLTFASRSVASLLDAYIRVAQEVCGNIGFLEGVWRFRDLVSEVRTDPVQSVAARHDIDLAQ
jgi:glycosyltransferase involved in cell wall biosynthesis